MRWARVVFAIGVLVCLIGALVMVTGEPMLGESHTDIAAVIGIVGIGLIGASGAIFAGNVFYSIRINTETMSKPSTNAFKKELPSEQREELLGALKTRFEKNMNRHNGLEWAKVQARLQANPAKLWVLHEMERTGGEPDVVGYDEKTGEYLFCDCAAESPTGRRNVTYDREGQEEREKKGIQPNGNVIDMAATIGIEVLTEEEYRELQKLGKFDTKTQSWLKTPSDIRKLGGAIFADRRYNHVFVYHNSAPSFYGGRAFRGSLRV